VRSRVLREPDEEVDLILWSAVGAGVCMVVQSKAAVRGG
jgi:hypothetical protein